jgi:hypothetical protein
MSRSRDIADSTKTLDVDGGTIKLDGNYPVGTKNVALGDTALDAVQSGAENNVAVGASALSSVTTGNDNTAVGNFSLASTTGSQNTGVGQQALRFNTSGQYNTAQGYRALFSNTSSSDNTAVGYQSLYSMSSTGDANKSTAVGYQAGYTSTHNVDAFGAQALYNNTTGILSVAMGREALYSNTTGSYNIAIGYQAGFFITTGSKNSILGRYNGNQGGLDIRTSSNNIVLSDGDGNPRISVNSVGEVSSNGTANNAVTYRGKNTNGSYGSVGIMSDITRTSAGGNYYHFSAFDRQSGSYRFQVHDDGDVVNVNNSYGSLSDVKLKENIVDSLSQWDDIKALTVRKYSMKVDELDAPNMLGVIAQEVEAAGMSGLVKETVDRDGEGALLDTSTKQVNYSILYMKAVKALQEAMERIETLETQNASFEARITALENA